ncbi:uncharacterized protein TNIN_227661 [Trichonephila inaurata madagascariensis]|uniref:Noggin n=1 Tax=Trichonephila inaurata madagascariensis TaxID=2747483 RepID=A0A8X6Y942_9ARAC|nr:uncharacterized protein TNIN_227661 [Trichonephila inaurata madagascariensis]
MSSTSYFRFFLLFYLCSELITSDAAPEHSKHGISYSKAVNNPFMTELIEQSSKPKNQSKGKENLQKGKKDKKKTKYSTNIKYSRRNLDQSRFMELMGPDFKKGWMASDNPYRTKAYESVTDLDIPQKWEKHELIRGMNKMNLTDELKELAPELLHQESEIRNYLLKRSACPTVFTWFDLGSTFWPRWIRKGDCENREEFCSFPPGMHCVPNRSKTVLVLQWTCDDKKKTPSRNDAVLQNTSWIQTIVQYNGPGPAEVMVQGREEHSGKKDKRRNRDKKRRNKGRKKREKDKKRRNKDKKRKNKDKKKDEEKVIGRSKRRVLPLRLWGSLQSRQPVPEIPTTQRPEKTRRKPRCSWIKVPYTITVDCFCGC